MYDRLHLPVRLAPRHDDVASASECSVAALPRRSMTMSSRFFPNIPQAFAMPLGACSRGRVPTTGRLNGVPAGRQRRDASSPLKQKA